MFIRRNWTKANQHTQTVRPKKSKVSKRSLMLRTVGSAPTTSFWLSTWKEITGSGRASFKENMRTPYPSGREIFRFVYCESFSGFRTESGVAKGRKARLSKDNATRKYVARGVQNGVKLRMYSQHSCWFPRLWGIVRFLETMTQKKSFLTWRFACRTKQGSSFPFASH